MMIDDNGRLRWGLYISRCNGLETGLYERLVTTYARRIGGGLIAQAENSTLLLQTVGRQCIVKDDHVANA